MVMTSHDKALEQEARRRWYSAVARIVRPTIYKEARGNRRCHRFNFSLPVAEPALSHVGRSTPIESKTEFWSSEITIAAASISMCLNPNEISSPNDIVILMLTKEFRGKRMIVYSAVAFNHVMTGG